MGRGRAQLPKLVVWKRWPLVFALDNLGTLQVTGEPVGFLKNDLQEIGQKWEIGCLGKAAQLDCHAQDVAARIKRGHMRGHRSIRSLYLKLSQFTACCRVHPNVPLPCYTNHWSTPRRFQSLTRSALSR